SVLLAEVMRKRGNASLCVITDGCSHSAFPIILKEISMKLRKTLMLAATVALLAFMGTVQDNEQETQQRHFSDWIDAQNTNFNHNSCSVFSLAFSPQDFSSLALVDFTGKSGNCVQNLHNGPTINTRVDGTVTERALPDGTAEITVNVHFRNAL